MKLKVLVLFVLFFGIAWYLSGNNEMNKNISDAKVVAGNITQRDFSSLSRGFQVKRGETDSDYIFESVADKNITVLVDAGHGGMDGGTEADGVLEKDINLDIALRLGALLKKSGVNILYTRENDTYISLKSRIRLANSTNADLLISVHNNALENDMEANGSSTLYYSSSKTKDDKMNGQKLAQIVQAELIGKLKTRDAGAISRKSLGILQFVKMPSVITEVGFITNPTDRSKLMTNEFRQKAAEALATGVIKAIKQM